MCIRAQAPLARNPAAPQNPRNAQSAEVHTLVLADLLPERIGILKWAFSDGDYGRLVAFGLGGARPRSSANTVPAPVPPPFGDTP